MAPNQTVKKQRLRLIEKTMKTFKNKERAKFSYKTTMFLFIFFPFIILAHTLVVLYNANAIASTKKNNNLIKIIKTYTLFFSNYSFLGFQFEKIFLFDNNIKIAKYKQNGVLVKRNSECAAQIDNQAQTDSRDIFRMLAKRMEVVGISESYWQLFKYLRDTIIHLSEKYLKHYSFDREAETLRKTVEGKDISNALDKSEQMQVSIVQQWLDDCLLFMKKSIAKMDKKSKEMNVEIKKLQNDCKLLEHFLPLIKDQIKCGSGQTQTKSVLARNLWYCTFLLLPNINHEMSSLLSTYVANESDEKEKEEKREEEKREEEKREERRM
ncbi:hypothetical protein RFI_32296 [Reticulomyxa filosa]|uniref:Uncharacterized protein n=1 Tax=Reticulomyxa filosa TaxID=46433 RepID=X6LWJ6_RETFI|nr:hypothetical protein RFI_32296 [Reticulomyxa filosa]|eukprot:ETO05100.1 hypothetical protein RFI_32296 [Reticulomyxa filosa]